MDLSKFLTIVIPCKNEGKIIEQTLSLLNFQKGIQDVRVIVCDSSDDDYTSYSLENRRTDYFNLQIISGGLPSVARNKGAENVETPYVLFLDADIFLLDFDILNNCIWEFLLHDTDLNSLRGESLTKDTHDTRSKSKKESKTNSRRPKVLSFFPSNWRIWEKWST